MEDPVNIEAPVATVREPSSGGVGPAIRIAAAGERPGADATERETVIELQDLSCYYGSFRAVRRSRSSTSPRSSARPGAASPRSSAPSTA
jgi:hypothetical protein